MKILFLIPYLGFSYGGTSRVVIELAKSLGVLGPCIDVVATNANAAAALDVPLQKWLEQDYFRVQYFPTWHRHDLIVSPSLIQWLIRHIKDYGIVHTHTLFAPLVSFTHTLCRYHKIPYVITPHGMLDPWALSHKAWKKRIYYSLFERPALKQASAVQVLSSSEKEQVSKLGYSQTIFIPNGIHKEDFESLPCPDLLYQKFPHLQDKKLILFLGRIDPKKGLDLLAPVFARVHAIFPDTHLVIAGPDSINFLTTVKSYFKDANCLNNVTFTSMLSGSIKYSALNAADIYVSPSYSEGFSLSVLEGMAAGLPCIITENCNFPEARAAKAAYVVQTHADDISDALVNCLQNCREAKALGNTARNFIFQNYTWKASSQKLLNAYEKILEKETNLEIELSV